MPTESFSHSATSRASLSDVWQALDQPGTWEAIAGVDRVRQPVIDDQGRLRGFLFDTVIAGRAYEGAATPNARDEGRLMAWDIANSQIKGVIHVALDEDPGGTRIDVRVDVSSVGMLSSMFFPIIARTIGEGLPRTVEELAATF